MDNISTISPLQHTSISLQVWGLNPQLCISTLIRFHFSPNFAFILPNNSSVACWLFTLCRLMFFPSSTATSNWASRMAIWCAKGMVKAVSCRCEVKWSKGTRKTRSRPTSPSMDVGKSDKFCLNSVRTSESGMGSGRRAIRVANWASGDSGGGMLVSSPLVALAAKSGRKRVR